MFGNVTDVKWLLGIDGAGQPANLRSSEFPAEPTSSGVRLCWELEKPKGPKGPKRQATGVAEVLCSIKLQ